MSEFQVHFAGLFAVVRHTAPLPPPTQGAPLPRSPITVVFPMDNGERRPEHEMDQGHGHGRDRQPPAPMHVVEMHVPATIGMDALGEIARVLGWDERDRHKKVVAATVDGYTRFTVTDRVIKMPLPTAAREPVEHQHDQDVPTTSEPRDNGACSVVGTAADWRPLSRLATLNTVTGVPFDRTALTPGDPRVQTVVELSGGRLESIRSCKALRDAFFEFFTNTRTVCIQPAVENVVFATPATGDVVRLGFGSRSDPEQVQELVVPWPVGTPPMVLKSLPPENMKPISLNHFHNYYQLMDAGRAEPFVRMIARCDEHHQLVHTMPGIDNTDPHCTMPRPLSKTVDTCSCLAAQVFTNE